MIHRGIQQPAALAARQGLTPKAPRPADRNLRAFNWSLVVGWFKQLPSDNYLSPHTGGGRVWPRPEQQTRLACVSPIVYFLADGRIPLGLASPTRSTNWRVMFPPQFLLAGKLRRRRGHPRAPNRVGAIRRSPSTWKAHVGGVFPWRAWCSCWWTPLLALRGELAAPWRWTGVGSQGCAAGSRGERSNAGL
jgi:hypothetical protein